MASSGVKVGDSCPHHRGLRNMHIVKSLDPVCDEFTCEEIDVFTGAKTWHVHDAELGTVGHVAREQQRADAAPGRQECELRRGRAARQRPAARRL